MVTFQQAIIRQSAATGLVRTILYSPKCNFSSDSSLREPPDCHHSSTNMESPHGALPTTVAAKFGQIRLLACDVDGVFSHGKIFMSNNGEELKAFHARDGYGVKALLVAGIDAGN